MTEEPQQQLDHSDEQDDYSSMAQRDPFTKEDLNNAHRLRNTNFKHPLHEMIDNANIYQSSKRALHLIVDDFLADNRFLTNLTSSGKGKDNILGTNLDLERGLIFASASFCPTDLKSPELTNIRNAIISHNRPTTLRCSGADRERRLQGKTMIASEQTITRNDSVQTQPQQPAKKGGFLSFLGGK